MTSNLPPADIIQAVYQSTASGNRVLLVDSGAVPFSVDNPLHVDTEINLTAGSIIISDVILGEGTSNIGSVVVHDGGNILSVDASDLDIRNLNDAQDQLSVVQTGVVGVSGTLTTINPGTVGVSGNQLQVYAASGDNLNIISVIPGSGATNLGKAIGDTVGSTDIGVLMLGVHDAESVKIAVSEEEFDHLHVDELGALAVSAEQHNHLDELDATTGWTVLNDDTDNLATTTNHVTGSNALTFDKVNGAGNTIFAGIQKTITTVDMGELDLHDIVQTVCFLSSLSEVDYVFVRIGTDSSNYNEWRVIGDDLNAGEFTVLGLPIGSASKTGNTGNGIDWGAISYIALGVAFDNQNDTLTGIIFDQIGLFTGLHSTASIAAEVSSSVSSPNVNIKKWGAVNVTNAGTLTDNMSSPTAPFMGAFGMWFDGSNWDRARGNATDGLLVNLGTNNDITATDLDIRNLSDTQDQVGVIQRGLVGVSGTNLSVYIPSGTVTSDLGTGRAFGGHNQVLVNTSATQIIAANSTRRGVQIFWSGVGVDLYLGSGTNVDTTSTGYLLLDGEWVTIPTIDAVHGITKSADGSAFYLEV